MYDKPGRSATTLWWADARGRLTIDRPPRVSAKQAFGGPADQWLDATHDDLDAARDGPLRGRIDHDKRRISLTTGPGHLERPVPGRALDAAYERFAFQLFTSSSAQSAWNR